MNLRKKTPSQTTTSIGQSRISWAEENLSSQGEDAIRDKSCFASLEISYLTQEWLNVLLLVNTLDLTPTSCTDLSLHYIFCLVAESDHSSWSILLTPSTVDLPTSLPWSFAMNSSRRRWDKMQLEHQCSNPASRTALASAPIKYRSAPLLHDTHSNPC